MSGGGGEQTVGYRYGLGFHIGLCHGPVDLIDRITIDEREAWTGTANASGTFSINKPELFGGDEREGGVVGSFDVMMGQEGQTPNAYLASVIEGAGGVIPAFLGIVSIVWKGGIITSNNPFIKAWAVRARRILQGWGAGGAWYSAKAPIDFGGGIVGMNPAHIVYQCLTNREWGMGYPTNSINDANFRAAADRFSTEGLGLCLIWNQQTEILDFVSQVCDHAAMNLVANPSTGLFELKLIRDDYTAGTLPIFGPAEIQAIDGFQRAGWGETVNEVTVKFNDQALGKGSSVTVQDLANIRAQGAIVPQSITYPGLPTQALAARVAARDLRAKATPLATMTIRGNRKLAGFQPGDVFRVNWPPLGLAGVVVRVLKVSGGSLQNGQVVLQCAEDVFSFPAASYVGTQPPGWIEPSKAPQASPEQIAFEAPRYELLRVLGAEAVAALPADAGFLAAAASKPSGASFDYGMQVAPGLSGGTYAEKSRGAFAPAATLAANVSAFVASITYTGARNIDKAKVGGYALIGGTEIVRIDSINTGTSTITIGRGVLDTTAKPHLSGESILFCDGFLTYDATQRVGGETARVKITPRTGQGELAIAAAAELTVTLNDRADRPYAPGRLRINGVTPASVIEDALSATWAHRNRLQQNLEGDETGNIGPEPGVTYSARVVRTGDEATVKAASSLFSPSWAPSNLQSGAYRLEIWSVRSGVESFDRQRHEFIFLATTLFGWNRAWGFRWGGVPLVEYNLRSAFDVVRIFEGAAQNSFWRALLPSGDYLEIITSATATTVLKWDSTGTVRRGGAYLAKNFRAAAYEPTTNTFAVAVDDGAGSERIYIADAELSLIGANSNALVRPGGAAGVITLEPFFSQSPSGIELHNVTAGGGFFFVSNTNGTDLQKYDAMTGALVASRVAGLNKFGNGFSFPMRCDGERVMVVRTVTTAVPTYHAYVDTFRISDLADEGSFELPATWGPNLRFPNRVIPFGDELVLLMRESGDGGISIDPLKVYRYTRAGAFVASHDSFYTSAQAPVLDAFGRYLSIGGVSPMQVFDGLAGFAVVPGRSYVAPAGSYRVLLPLNRALIALNPLQFATGQAFGDAALVAGSYLGGFGLQVSSGYVQVPGGAGGIFDATDRDFTFEANFEASSTADTGTVFAFGDTPTDRLTPAVALLVVSGAVQAKVTLGRPSGSAFTLTLTGPAISAGDKVHAAVQRRGDTVELAVSVNGAAGAIVDTDTAPETGLVWGLDTLRGEPLTIGGGASAGSSATSSADNFVGVIEQVRASIGSAVYSAGYTAPASF